ncbi:MAG: vitamin B12-dependent ribonucleotide reductase [Candidatus Deferrimicrobium sp.]|nr:vitamin B12-dependent ribonucleotide reductase [Candidatus Deferrimicrobium sp.]MDO8739877.1 vitamin B12-dependent ribonucleotide reductase [Candidatus Deferrimicrobium sp.]
MKRSESMDLNVPATLTSPASAGLNDGPARPAGKTLHDHPPQAWAETLLRKYGPMPVSENALTVLERRYLKKGMKGDPLETPEEMACRVAYNIALAESLYYGALPEVALRWAEAFYAMMLRLDFLPNSPTLMNAGRELQQLSACFVLPVEDSMESIFEAVKNTALIHKSGGGTGFSFSRLRPHADIVRSTKGVSSGPISFMTVFDAATETIKQGGTRRGANMGILRVDHPDILDFITCKSQTNRLNNFNISVALTEEFMKAVENGEEYSLVNPHSREVTARLPAREVFERIVDSSWKNGEPGMIFIDRINRDNPTPRIGAIESTNPCGEQPLLPYESCNLGSINLANMIATQDGHARIDYDKLKATVQTAVRFLDDVIDMNNYPLAEIRHMTVGNRKIGLGVMGFADMLIGLGIPYDSDEALAVAQELMSFVQEESGAASCNLARERGPFPNYDVSVFPERGGAKRRNATTTTIAPTGTISIIAGVSSGIEPIFALSYIRNVMDNDHLVEVHPLFDAEMRRRGLYSAERMTELSKVGTLRHLEGIPEDVARIYVTAHDISPEAHLRMQAAFQKYTENAVSKTVNFPTDATRDDIRKVFVLAYRLGCKGVTVYRDKSRAEQVLNIGGVNAKAGAQEQAPVPGPEPFVTPRPRPDTLIGVTKEIKTSCGKLYVTINRDEKGIFEVFNQMGKAGGCAASQSEAIGRLASLALRSGVQPGMIVKQLKGISCHLPSWGGNGGKILSCADAVSKAIEWYLENFEAMFPGFPKPAAEAAQPAMKRASLPAGEEEIARGACPDCGSQVERQEGCLKCRSCGFSEC